jgi:hypothetical protein
MDSVGGRAILGNAMLAEVLPRRIAGAVWGYVGGTNASMLAPVVMRSVFELSNKLIRVNMFS